MYFASKKVYVKRNNTQNTELVDQINLNEPTTTLPQLSPRSRRSKREKSKAPKKKQKRVRRRSRSRSRSTERVERVEVESANTNVVSIELGCIVDEGEIMTGDPTHCESCLACFSSFSELVVEGEEQVWVCEYCENRNVVFIEPEEVPKTNTCDYIVKPATREVDVDEETIIFVVDISGSMCVTTEIEGRHTFKSGKTESDIMGNLNVGLNGQFLPNQRRNVSYVSRLQCVQTAIESQVELLSNTQPNSKVGLVTFSNEVTIVGDGIQNPVTVAGDRLDNKDKLLEIGSSYTINSNIGESKLSFLNKMYDLSEGGATSLGPAVLVAIGMAQQAKNATIVIATDGLANIGVGSMEGLVTNDEIQQLSDFYRDAAQYAQSEGITINVISIAGEQVNMENLGKLADQTQGEVNIVDPVKITDEFADILQSKVIATNVEATFHLHKGLNFSDISNEDQHDLANNCITRMVGNAFKETELTFEFTVNEENAEDLLASASELPFQVAIKYTLANGLEGLRVITQAKDMTDDRQEAETDIDFGIMGMHNNWRSAKLAEQGDYDQVISHNLAVQNLMQRNVSDDHDRTTYDNYVKDSNSLNRFVSDEQRECRNINNRSDTASNAIYQMKSRKRNAKAYKKKY